MVAYNNKKYYIDIVETKPSNAISIIETDCEVDFAPPLDYKEPERQKAAVPPSTAPTAEEAAEEEPKFIPFTGPGRRLDGKAPKDKDVSASSPAKRQANATNSVQPSTASTSQSSSSRKTTEKLVFGPGGNRTSKETEKVPEKEPKEDPKKDEPKFSAFTGRKYSLKG
jgi:ubiquitin fusion degradation protein 1